MEGDWTAVDNILKTSTLSGLTLEDIVEHLHCTGITVTSIQNALNPKHLESFLAKKQNIQDKVKESTVGVEIAFHGTAAGNVRSIYKQSFRLMHKTSFATFCSPLFRTAFNYGKKKIGFCRQQAVDTPIFICATLRGRVYVPEGRILYLDQPMGFDSSCWGGDQWLLYDTRQIIPVAVLWTRISDEVYEDCSKEAFARYHMRPEPGCGSGIDISKVKGKRTGNRRLDLPRPGYPTKRKVGESFFSFLIRRLNAL
jgi:hypothetical protein